MILAFLLFFLVEINAKEVIFTEVVDTEYGPVRGEKRVLNEDVGIVNVFLGIPYATPPIGELRFRHPVSPAPWINVYNATEFPNICIQSLPPYPMDEDCLYLSIFAPDNEGTNKPVMVWIHGGAFTTGDINQYNGGYLAAFNDVIVVNIAYRLGALGFMSIDIADMPGNAGMMDQVFALEWVQRNIANFGGDPKKVTIFGESAGAASVGLHLISPLSQNLYIRAIMQSGAPSNHWAYKPHHINLRSSFEIANSLGCNHSDSVQILECLLSVPADGFIQSEFFQDVGVIVDGKFMMEPPNDAMENGNFNKVKILIGSNANEGSVFLLLLLPEYFNKPEPTVNSSQFIDSIEKLFEFNPNPDGTSQAGINALLFEYTNWEDIEDVDANIQQLDYAYADSAFVCGVQRTADLYAEADQDVFFYQFTHRYEHHITPEWMGVIHGDDLAVVFGFPFSDFSLFNFTSEERQLSFEIMKHWSNFAKTGDPNIDDNGEVMVSKWPVYAKGIREYKDFNASWMYEPESIKSGSLRPHQCAFFQHYLPQVEAGCP